MRMNNSKELSTYLVFAVVGMIFLIVGIFLTYNTLFSKTEKIQTTGIITSIERERNTDDDYEVWVQYDADGRTYESELGAYVSSFYEGQTIDIYYEKENPKKIGTEGTDLIVLMFPAIGLITVGLGVGGFISKMKRKKEIEELKANGQLIHATFVEATKNMAYAINGRHPYNVFAEWMNPMDGRTYTFKSENVWGNTWDMIGEYGNAIKEIPVYVDKENAEKYYMDLDSIV